MHLTSLLTKNHVFPNLSADNKSEAIRLILNGLQNRGMLSGGGEGDFDPGTLHDMLMKREEKGSTGLGSAVGYPHTRIDGFDDVVVAVATFPDGVDYQSQDDLPIQLVVMAIVPPEKNNLLLGVMTCVSRLVANKQLVETLVNTDEREALWSELNGADLEIKESLTAADIMKQNYATAHPDMTLAEAAVLMHEEHMDALPVVDAAGALIGDITARKLFATCVPPYFSEMPSMRFARDFDAFEHFFEEKAHQAISDVANENCPVIEPSAPLAEVIALLTHEGLTKVYVVKDKQLEGIIDNFSIIDKVLSI